MNRGEDEDEDDGEGYRGVAEQQLRVTRKRVRKNNNARWGDDQEDEEQAGKKHIMKISIDFIDKLDFIDDLLLLLCN